MLTCKANSEIVRVEEGLQEEDWATTMPKLICTLLHESLTSTRNLPSTRVSHAVEGVQWVRMEELGRALRNRCLAVGELPYKRQKKLMGTRDRATNGEQVEFECQLKTPTILQGEQRAWYSHVL